VSSPNAAGPAASRGRLDLPPCCPMQRRRCWQRPPASPGAARPRAPLVSCLLRTRPDGPAGRSTLALRRRADQTLSATRIPSTSCARTQNTEKGKPKSHENQHKLTQSKSPEGTRREGPPFPSNPWYKVSNFHHKILTPRGEEGGRGRTRRGDGKSASALGTRQGKKERGERKGVRGFLTQQLSPKKTTLPLDSI